ncbi:MAG: alcohol dehydrogenase catalytic domain-containing protein [Actinomycetia bacterium]|nr:alcohol dehydrogenase catalytic domain-containing protein [Actinomycetes bacterium]
MEKTQTGRRARCAVLAGPGSLAIGEREFPAASPDGVLLAVEVCGVCRTDRKAFHMGQRDLVFPRVLGHEIVGHLLDVGSAVVGFEVGERVQVFPGVACGSCEYCQHGIDNLCDKMQIIGFHLDGGFSELLSLSGDILQSGILNKVPEGLDSRTASLAEPLACSLNMLKRLSLQQAETVVVFGAGPLGVLTSQLARVRGAERIVIVEPMAARRALSTRLADLSLDFDNNTASAIMDFSHGRGADVVLPCCPGNDAFQMGLEVAAKRGQIGFFSGLTDASDIGNSALNHVHYRELSLVGAYGCSSTDDREALELLATGQVGMADLPTRDISWPELPEVLFTLDPFEHVFTFFYPTPKELEL